MRKIWVALFCIAFSMSGSLIPAAHNLAHAEMAQSSSVQTVHDHHLDHDDHALANAEDSEGEPIEPPQHTDHSGEHGAELHFSAIQLPTYSVAIPFFSGEARTVYMDQSHTSPFLPPDPDPDRA